MSTATLLEFVRAGRVPCPEGLTVSHLRGWSDQRSAAYLRALGIEPSAPSSAPGAGVEPAEASAPVSDAARMIADAVRMIAERATPKAPPIDAEAVESIARRVAEEVAARAVANARLPQPLAVSWANREAVDVGTQHHQFPTLCRAVGALSVRNILLVGPSGTGKTAAAHALAKSLGLAYRSQSACIMPHDLLGYRDAGGTYHETPFVATFRLGGVCMLDELDTYSERASLALNEALSNGSMQIGTERINRHPDCIIIAGANTWGTGANASYTGRARLDAALLARFPVQIAWGHDAALERALAGEEAASIVQKARDALHEAGQAAIADRLTMRHAIALGDLLRAGFDRKEAATLCLTRGLPDHAALRILSIVED